MIEEITIPGHEIKKVTRTGYGTSYGDQIVERSEDWLVCSCGWEHKIASVGADKGADERLARLEHGLDAIASQSCTNCSPNHPCTNHCPRRSRHGGLKAGTFCAGCGQQFNK